MAHITLAGVLLDPTGEFSVGDKVRFTHQSTTGNTMKSAVSVLKVPPNGAYSINLEYGLVLVEYNDYRLGQYRNLGIATVNATNTATSIPELLNALVPVSDAELIQFQAIQSNCVTAQNAASASAAAALVSENAAAASAATLDLINDVSQDYAITEQQFNDGPIPLINNKPITITDSGVSRSGFIRVSVAHGLTNDGRNIRVIDANTYWEMKGNDEQEARYRKNESVPLTTTSLNGVISEFISSTNRRKPRVSPIINEKAQRIMGADYCDYVSPQSKGASSGGAVFGPYKDVTNTTLAPEVLFLAPIDNVSGSVSMSLTIDSIDGSDLGLLGVQWCQWNSYENGSTQIGTRTSVSRSGNTWTVSPVLPGTANIGDMFGWRITSNPASGDYELADASLTDSAGKVYRLTKRMKQNLIINLVAVATKRSVLTQEFGGVEVRNHGFKSGYVPAKFLASPEANASSGLTGAEIGGTQVAGHDFSNPLPPSQCWYKAEVYFINGYVPPSIILAKGTYINYYSVGHIRPFNTAIFTRPSEWFIGCPNGLATLSNGASSDDGLILGAASGSIFPKIYLMNMHCDESVTRPYTSTRMDIDALNISTAYSDDEGIDIDFSDVTIEGGEFYGALNDGVNSQGSGHTILIDTICRDNIDDGFSPHNNCTYEVHGGVFSDNGKGNIIPAFGAKGFVVSTESSGSTGLSPRAATTAGVNDGGYVCISDDGDQATTMFIVNSTSDNDNYGYVSAGKNCLIYAVDCPVTTPVNRALVSNFWDSATSSSFGDAGVIITNTDDISTYNITDGVGIVTSYKPNAHRWV